MRPKSVFTILLMAFVIGSLGYLAAKEMRPSQPPVEPTASAPVSAPAQTADQTNADAPAGQGPETPAELKPGEGIPKVIVYYFHGNVRCATCMKLEAYAHEAVETGFADALASGKLEWQVINVDESAGAHYVTDYDLVTRSVVISKMQGGHEITWRNLDEIWDLVSDKTAYLEYVQTNIREIMDTPTS